MDLQRHNRIAHIKRWSAYLSKVLVCGEWLLLLAWPLSLLAIFSSGPVPGTDGRIDMGELTLPGRAVVMIAFWCGLALLHVALHNFRVLMDYFSQGQVFNDAALHAGHRSLRAWIMLLVFDIACRAAVTLHAGVGESGRPGFEWAPLVEQLINGAVMFMLLYVLLWTLEIGRDLNDESSLTI